MQNLNVVKSSGSHLSLYAETGKEAAREINYSVVGNSSFCPCLFLCHLYGTNTMSGCDAVEKVLYVIRDYFSWSSCIGSPQEEMESVIWCQVAFRVWVKILLLRNNSLPITMIVITFSILTGFTKAGNSTEKEPV